MPDPEKPEVDTNAPAAGGWVPTPKERAIGIGIVSTLGALAPGLLAAFPGTPGIVCACVCGAIALGVTAALGMNSAGPRKLS